MAGHSPLQAKAFTAEAAIPKRRIVKFGAADTGVILAAAAADTSIGITSEIAAAIGEVTDVFLLGIADVEYGGPVTRGAKLTSDAAGRAVAAGAGAHVVGFAMVSGVIGDIGAVFIAQSVM